MSKIPATSQVTPFGGTWFVFRDGEREIVAHNSLLSKESVFVNRKIVSENRSLNRIGKHQFIFEGTEYEVVFAVYKILECEMECSLIKNNICIEKFKTYYNGKSIKSSNIKRFMVCFIIGIFASFFVFYFKIPPLVQVLAAMVICFLIISKADKDAKVVIERVER